MIQTRNSKSTVLNYANSLGNNYGFFVSAYYTMSTDEMARAFKIVGMAMLGNIFIGGEASENLTVRINKTAYYFKQFFIKKF